MAHIVGCVKAHELTTCQQGANQHAHILFKKSVVNREKTGGESPTDQPNLETTPMSIAAMKRVASMNEVTKSFFVALDDTAAEAFLAKAVEDQDKVAADAKKAVDEAAAVIEAQKSGKTVAEAALEKSNATIAELQKRLDANDVTREIEKEASHADYQGFPGGEASLVPQLKAIRSLPAEMQKTMTDGFKRQAAFAKSTGAHLGLPTTEEEITKAAPTISEVTKKAKALQTADPLMNDSIAQATVFKAHPNLLMAALAEESALQAQF